MADRTSEAIARAQISQLNLVGLMAAHGISRSELGLLLDVPGPIRHAMDDCHTAVLGVAALLAAADGVESWPALPTQRKTHYQAIAYEAIMSAPMPTVAHASTPPLQEDQ